ncbi:MAG: Fic family protein [Verrucomicrobiaceae bacterium]|nr:MAG: Fic family protein [Verrucomicrobiaceae bacterium]
MPPENHHSLYRNIASMEPMMPRAEKGRLAELSAEIFSGAGELRRVLPSAVVREELARLVRGMNSYYSNLIEGHKTLPRDIERALAKDFSRSADDRRNQEMSAAHVRTEEAMRLRLREDTGTDVFSAEFIRWLHREFYSNLPKKERVTVTESGKRYPLEPGELRGYHVDVGSHQPPDHEALPQFMERFHRAYSGPDILATERLVAMAAAHHRLAWIHPFGDGNGRVARLQSQAAMIRAGVDGEGLWTLSRGIARARGSYYQHLRAADRGRAGDLDGRGNLSDKALAGFCIYLLELVLDQVKFMIDLIDPVNLVSRVEKYFQFVRTDLEPRFQRALPELLGGLVMQGELQRGAVGDILGLKGTAAREVIRKALDEGLVSSPSEKGVLRIAFPDKVVEYWLPGLFTDLPVDGE